LLLKAVSCKLLAFSYIKTKLMNQELTKSQLLALEIQEITEKIQQLAQNNQDDVLFLLALLRNLEQAHRQIRTTMFEASLPTTRNDLYNFVRDIEEEGGWPYIERMKLQELLKNISLDVAEDK
jgi:hypothetical protein